MDVRRLFCRTCGYQKEVPLTMEPLPGNQVRMWFCANCTPRDEKGAPKVTHDNVLVDKFGLI